MHYYRGIYLCTSQWEYLMVTYYTTEAKTFR